MRDHGSVARIEVARNERKLFFDEQLLDRISDSLRELGFVHVAIRHGRISFGKHERALTPRARSEAMIIHHCL